MTAAGSDELQGESGEGFGQHDGFTAEPQPYFVVVVLDVFQGEAADGRWPLGVEQEQQTCDAVFGFDGFVVQQPAGLFPACFGVDDACWSAPSGCGIGQLGQPLFLGPSDEVAGFGPVCGVVVGEPAIEIGLPAGCERQVVRGQPIEEGDRAAKVLASCCELVVGGFGAFDSAAQSPEQVPDAVAVVTFR